MIQETVAIGRRDVWDACEVIEGEMALLRDDYNETRSGDVGDEMLRANMRAEYRFLARLHRRLAKASGY